MPTGIFIYTFICICICIYIAFLYINMAARRLFSTQTRYTKRNGVPGTLPAHDQHMTAHDDDDDVNDDNVDNVDKGDNVDNHPHKYVLK